MPGTTYSRRALPTAYSHALNFPIRPPLGALRSTGGLTHPGGLTPSYPKGVDNIQKDENEGDNN